MKWIDRPQYLQRLLGLQNTPDIKIITGIRRCGKSCLLRAFRQQIQRQDPAANILSLDFTDLDWEEFKDYRALHRYAKEHVKEGAANYLLIDEVQLCTHFELAINSLHAAGQFDIYLTGSNAFLLSGDLATLFTGRYIEIPVFPFSFAEYCRYFEEKSDMQAAFDDYALQGGLAGSYAYRSEQDRAAYIQEVYRTIVTRDLVQKYRLPDITVLEHLSEYLMDNISNLTSPNRVSDTLTANQIATNHVTVGRYIKYLCNAFVFYDTKRYDIKGRRYLETADKYYLCDTGIRYAVLGHRNLDYGRLYENIVNIELRRRGYDVYVGKLYQKEIDFVALRGSEKLYIQVSDDISRGTTFEREVAPLLAIKDAYPKMILARTRHPKYDYEGIDIWDLPQWLREEGESVRTAN